MCDSGIRRPCRANPRRTPGLRGGRELVTDEMVAGTVTCGADPHRHLDMVGKHIDAGFDEIYVQQIGPDQEAFFDGWANKVLPQLR